MDVGHGLASFIQPCGRIPKPPYVPLIVPHCVETAIYRLTSELRPDLDVSVGLLSQLNLQGCSPSFASALLLCHYSLHTTNATWAGPSQRRQSHPQQLILVSKLQAVTRFNSLGHLVCQ